MTADYRTESEIVNLAKKNADTKTHQYLSDMRVGYFGSSRRSEIIAKVKDWNNSTKKGHSWHDEWQEWLSGQGVAASMKTEERRAVFHKTDTYP